MGLGIWVIRSHLLLNNGILCFFIGSFTHPGSAELNLTCITSLRTLMFYMTHDSLPTLCWQQSRQGALTSKARCCSIKKKAHTIPYKQAPDDNGTERGKELREGEWRSAQSVPWRPSAGWPYPALLWASSKSFMLNLKAESKLGVMTVCSLLHHHNN